MAGFTAAPRGDARVVGSVCILAAFVFGASVDPAQAQSPAPIVYKSSAPAPMMMASLDRPAESRPDSMSLNVAPHAPVPSFSKVPPAPPHVQLASIGPVPPVIAPYEQSSSLRTVAPPASPAMATPYAGPAYQVDGKWYVPAHEPNYNEVGIASWYGPNFHGKDSASGEPFDQNAMTAAHPTLPIPSLVRVTNLQNGRAAIVRLNDRGPFVDDRIIDLSHAAAGALDMHGPGTARVRVEYVGPAPALPNSAAMVAQQPEGQGIVSRPLAPVAAPLPPAPAPLVPAVDSQASGEAFFLQAGSFADLGNANKLRDSLRPLGTTSIKAAIVNGSEFYRVMLGPWSSREEADRALHSLSGSGVKAIVVAGNR